MRVLDMVHTRDGAVYFTAVQVANMLNVSKSTLHNWIQTGKIPRPERHRANGYYRWTQNDVDAIRAIMRDEK
jgi:DNA-binding transcriptional MerR regulator